MYKARARTDELGRTLASGMTYNADPVSHNATIDVKRTQEPANWTHGVFGDILGSSSKFLLLSSYLMKKLNPNLRSKCSYGNRGMVYWVKLDGKTYWSLGHSIHDIHGVEVLR